MADKSMLSALNEALETKQAEAERIAAAFPHEDGKFAIPPEMHRDYVAAVREAQEVKQLIDAAQAFDAHSEYLNAPEGKSVAAEDAGRDRAQMEAKDLGAMFIESDAYRSYAEGSQRGPISIHAAMEGKSLFTLAATDGGATGDGRYSAPAFGSAQNVGIAEVARRKMHIRDLFPKSTTKSNLLYGLRETGWVNNAAQVKERYAADGVSAATGGASDVFGQAPKSELKLVPVTYPIAEVAHTLDAHKNLLSDDSRLRTFINTRMIEGVKYAEDYDLLHSVGDGESITGLFNTPGIQSYTGLTTDKKSVQIRRAITKAELAEYEPTGLVVSPSMWEEIEVEEDGNGAFRVALAVAVGAEKKVWHLNVVKTTAMADANFLVGAFGLGAQLHDREAVSVSASTENKDNMERGVVTFRADERVALEVPRPESFVVGTWDNTL